MISKRAIASFFKAMHEVHVMPQFLMLESARSDSERSDSTGYKRKERVRIPTPEENMREYRDNIAGYFYRACQQISPAMADDFYAQLKAQGVYSESFLQGLKNNEKSETV